MFLDVGWQWALSVGFAECIIAAPVDGESTGCKHAEAYGAMTAFRPQPRSTLIAVLAFLVCALARRAPDDTVSPSAEL